VSIQGFFFTFCGNSFLHLETHEVTCETAGMEEFFQAVDGLRSRVPVLFREP